MQARDRSGAKDDREDPQRLPSIRDLLGIAADEGLGSIVPSQDGQDPRTFSLAELQGSLPNPSRRLSRAPSVDLTSPPDSPVVRYAAHSRHPLTPRQTPTDFATRNEWRPSSRSFSSTLDPSEDASPRSVGSSHSHSPGTNWSQRLLPPLQTHYESGSIPATEAHSLPPLSSTFPLLQSEGSGRGRSFSDVSGPSTSAAGTFMHPAIHPPHSGPPYGTLPNHRRHASSLGGPSRSPSNPITLQPRWPSTQANRPRHDDHSRAPSLETSQSNALQFSPLPAAYSTRYPQSIPLVSNPPPASLLDPHYHYLPSSSHPTPNHSESQQASPSSSFGVLRPSATPYVPPALPSSTSSQADDSVMEDSPEETKIATTAKYECPYCTKRFNRPSSLKIHVNTHTGAKPFVCPFPECGRRFSVMSNMRRHARVHTTNPRTGNEFPPPAGSGGSGSSEPHSHYPPGGGGTGGPGSAGHHSGTEERQIPSPTFSAASASSYSRSSPPVPSPQLNISTPTVVHIHHHHHHHSSSEGRMEYRIASSTGTGVRRSQSHQSSLMNPNRALHYDTSDAPSRHFYVSTSHVSAPAPVSGRTGYISPSESSVSSGGDLRARSSAQRDSSPELPEPPEKRSRHAYNRG